MGGNSMSALYHPIDDGDVVALNDTLKRFGSAVPLLLQKQFIINNDSACLDLEPIFQTPLQFCISKNEPECLKILLENGGDPRERGKGGVTLLHKAIRALSLNCVMVLLASGADVSDCDEWGKLPIHECASAYGDSATRLEIFDLVISAGRPTDIHLADEQGKTTLHYAAYHGNVDICKRLLELGADINAKCKGRRTPYQTGDKHRAVREYLKSQGCEMPEPPPPRVIRPLPGALRPRQTGPAVG